MGRHKINRSRWLAAATFKHVRGTRKPRCKPALCAGITAPKAPHVIAEFVVPFTPSTNKISKLITAGPHIPGLGDMNNLRQHIIIIDRLEQWCMRVKARRHAAHDGGEVIAKAIDAALQHPVAQRGNHQINIGSPV